MTENQAECWNLRQQGFSIREIAERLNISHNAARMRLRSASQWADASEGHVAALEATGLDPERAKFGWRIIQHEDGSRDSVFWDAREEDHNSPEDVVDQIADRLNKVKPAPAIKRPKQTASNLRNFLPLFDVHMSMRIGDYGTADAVERLRAGSEDILCRLPAAECTIIVNGGDFTHQNDPSNLTPQSKHPLPVDAEYDDTTDIATDITAEIIDRALSVSDKVVYKALRGNHDPNTARILRAALRQRYRKNDRVEIDDHGIDFFVHRFGGNFLGVHHGDARGKGPKDYVLAFAARYATIYGETRHRELHTGHKHNLQVMSFPGWRTYQHDPICPKDRHSEEQLWESVSEMNGVCFKESGGRYDSITHYFG